MNREQVIKVDPPKSNGKQKKMAASNGCQKGVRDTTGVPAKVGAVESLHQKRIELVSIWNKDKHLVRSNKMRKFFSAFLPSFDSSLLHR